MRYRLLLLLLAPGLLSAQGPLLATADSAIAAGQPWRATTLMAPVLAHPAGRTPEALLTAARAAAGWRGWPTVRGLIGRESWLDSRFDRVGRRLLAEAALGEQQLQQALAHARAAMATGDGRRDRTEQGRRYLILARVQDRLDMLDSSSANYQRAASLLPDVGDWLLLRAAGLTSDSTDRATMYGRIVLPAARPRILWTEALAWDRIEAWDRSAERYERLGAFVTALRVRGKGARTDSARARLRRDFLSLLTPQLPLADTRDVVDFLGTGDATFGRKQQLVLARAAAAVGRSQIAATLFTDLARAQPLEPTDQLNYANALAALKKWTEASRQYRLVTDPRFAGEAAYYQARALLRAGDETASVAALREVIRAFPADSFAAGTATYLLGDLMLDAGYADTARILFRQVVERFPTSSFRSRSLIAAAIIAYENGEALQAVAELSDGLLRNPPTGLEQDAWRYWLGRAQLATGDTAARTTLRAVIARGPENYYAIQAARRLDTIPWAAPVVVTPTIPRALQAAFDRVRLLESLGLDVEARFELDRIAADASGAPALVQTAQAFAAAGYAARAQQTAQRAQAAGAPRDGTLLPLLYPFPFAGILRENATRVGLDPFLAASVIRQESGFDPRAVSRTDARGLMQIMPEVGEAMADGLPGTFDVAMLFIPDVNLAFGTKHLADKLTKYPERERALAAYNAGETPIRQWSGSLLGGAPLDSLSAPLPDLDMFIERIPYVETRDYVRNVMRNYSMYRLLYGGVP